jgi:hypothetical protein
MKVYGFSFKSEAIWMLLGSVVPFVIGTLPAVLLWLVPKALS